jgi:hypothetical protein
MVTGYYRATARLRTLPRRSASNQIDQLPLCLGVTLNVPYASGRGRLPSVEVICRDRAVVQTPVFAPVQETV